jgi:hypothetical protein
MLARERDTWTPTHVKEHNIRDVPVGAADDTNGSATAVAQKVPASGPIATALDERTAPIRKRLSVRSVQRVGIMSMARSCRRQVLHYDYSDGQYAKWRTREKSISKKLSKKPPARYPWTLLVSLQPGGKLIVEKQGDGGGAVVIELDAGDAVLFRSGSNKHGLRRQTNMVVPRTPISTCASMSIGNPRAPRPMSFASPFATLAMQAETSCML